jgi:hypothetical protein
MSNVMPIPSSPASSGLTAVLSRLLVMLHKSRRRDAARVIHRHRHLLTGRADGQLSGPVFEMESYPRAFPAASDEAIRTLRKLVKKVVVAVFLLTIGAAHIVGATVILHAATSHQSQAAVPALQGD